MTRNPTQIAYQSLQVAYDWFNQMLFDSQLPPCLITLQRKKNTLGYFSGDAAIDLEVNDVTDEIALNPTHFWREHEDVLSTLVHEMVHLWQHHFGKCCRHSYHNKQWAAKMESFGLIPSETGCPGGKKTGNFMSHFIHPTGRFAAAYQKLQHIQDNSGLYGDLPAAIKMRPKLRDELPPELVSLVELATEKTKKKRASKTNYRCPSCRLNAWAKPNVQLTCTHCQKAMEAVIIPEPAPQDDALDHPTTLELLTLVLVRPSLN